MNHLVDLLQSQAPRAISTDDLLHPCARLLSEIRSTALLPGQAATIRPLIPLADSTLLVNASGEPSVGQALIHEIPSAQRIDLLCVFIKYSGLRLLQPAFREFLQTQPRRQLRELTTAYIGSSNLSTAALHDGLEWNVRLSALDNEGILAKFQAAFESYWEEGEFEPYRTSEIVHRRFDRAAANETTGDPAPLSFFDIRPYAYSRRSSKSSRPSAASMLAGATWWWPPPARAKP